jgi:hypothetical protein
MAERQMPTIGGWTAESWELSRQLAISLGQIPTDIRPQGRVTGPQSPEKEKSEMSLLLTAEEGGTKLDPGTYPVKCMDVKEDKLANSQFGNGEVIRFDLEVIDVLDEDGNPITLDGIANRKLTPGSKLWKWLEAFGLKMAVGERVDIEQIVGRQAFAVVVSREGAKGGTFARIENLVPAPSSTAAAGPVEEMEISAWWALVRSEGFNTSDGRNKAEELFKKEPKDLNGIQRAEVLTALREG